MEQKRDDDDYHTLSILENVGFNVVGPDKLHELLSKAKKKTTLCATIRKFQSDRELTVLHLGSALKLLDSQGIARSEFYDLCLTKLADKIKWRIEDMRKTKDGDSRLRFHLGEFFRMHSAPPFRPIVIKLIESISPYIDEHFLYAICKTEELYKNCNMQVKRVCWKMNEELFFDEIRTKVNEYLKNKEDIICSIDPNQTNFFTKETTKSRRNWPQIPEIIAMIGKNDILYKVFMKYLRNQFNEVANFHLCSLKSEFTIAAHEKGIEDPLYNFAWALDTCVRDKSVDWPHLSKIRHAMDDIGRSNDISKLIDFSMIAADLHVVYFFATSLLRKLQLSHPQLPRYNQHIITICRFLMIAANVKRISVTRQKPTAESFDQNVIIQFLPMFSSLLAQDTIRVDILKREKKGAKIRGLCRTDSLSNPPSEEITQFLENNSTAALLWTIHCIGILPMTRDSVDLKGVLRYFSALPIAIKTLTTRGVWTHLLCHTLMVSSQFEPLLRQNQQFHQVIMEQIIHENLMEDDIMKYQILRLINQLGYIWGVPRCLQMMEVIQPGSENVCISSAHDSTRFRQNFQKVTDKLQPKTPLSPPKFPSFGSPPPFGSPR